MRRGLAAAAASAVVALAFAPLFAGAAHAQGAVTVDPSPLTISPAPDGAGNIATNTLSASGHFHVSGGIAPAIDWVTVTLSWRGPAPGPPMPAPYTMCGTPPAPAKPGQACSSPDEDFKNIPLPLLPQSQYNGPYQATATGHAVDQVGGQQAQATTQPPVLFNLRVPPPNVNGVTAIVDTKTRDVTVSWDRDATTPDVQSYWIWRKGPGDADFKAAKQVLQLKSGARISVTDTDTECRAGDYTYEVETHRNGATGDNNSTVVSDRSKGVTAKAATVPSGPPCTTTPTTSPPGSGGAPPVVKGTPSGTSHSTTFSGSSSGSSSALATTPTTEVVTPDPGFVRGLPYAGSNANDQNSEGDNSAVAVTPGRHSSSGGKGYLVPIAGASVLVLGALHLRYFKKRLDEPPGTGLTPVG